MARPSPEPDLDGLYRLPPGDFIAARNALARTAGSAAAAVKALAKPTLPAWAVNQLYWQDRDLYTALIDRAGDLRATHDAALRGERADLRGASRAHEAAVEAALKATLALLTAAGHPLTDPTRQAVATTLRSLPSDDPPGRLARPLQPRGFDGLTGAAPAGRVRALPPPEPTRKGAKTAPEKEAGTGSTSNRGDKAEARRAARLAAARDAVAAAGRAVREAEQLARREEFEAARAAREADKADRLAAAAAEALKVAQAELEEATSEAARSAAARDSAQARAGKAAAALAAARKREEAARRDHDALT